jgi:hypothetical protein
MNEIKSQRINQMALNLHIEVRAVLVHRDFADESSLAETVGLVSQDFASAFVDGSEIRRSCCP